MTDATAASTVDCPFCGEQILAKARKCKHCGEFLDGTGPRRSFASQATQSHAPPVYMNAGGGGGASGNHLPLRPWGHGVHILLSIFTLGLWVPVWFLLYICRNKAFYY